MAVQRPHVDLRAKERLTGAVILVALIVLLVPELLSGPGQRVTRTAEASDEPPLRSVTMELNDELRGAAAARSDAELVAPPSAASASTGSGSGGASVAAQSSASAPTLRAPPAVAAPQPQPQPPARALAAREPARAAVSVRAARTARPQPLAASGGWSVQVGSFEGREHADRFVARLKRAGFAAFVTESAAHGRKWYRVRVGPERDRTAARAMAVRLQAAGHPASIVSP